MKNKYRKEKKFVDLDAEQLIATILVMVVGTVAAFLWITILFSM